MNINFCTLFLLSLKYAARAQYASVRRACADVDLMYLLNSSYHHSLYGL